MNKIINGAKYDTSTAKELGHDSFSNPGDFNHWKERLFRTKSGKYFLHGTGGGLTKYAKSYDNNSWSGGEEIITMSREAAQKWAEEHLTADEYEEIFGTVDETGEKEALNLNISPALKSRLWEMAEKEGLTISAVAEKYLIEGLDYEPKIKSVKMDGDKLIVENP